MPKKSWKGNKLVYHKGVQLTFAADNCACSLHKLINTYSSYNAKELHFQQ